MGFLSVTSQNSTVWDERCEPGKRKVTISLPGYQTFETDIDPVANQKSTFKTTLVKGGAAEGISPE